MVPCAYIGLVFLVCVVFGENTINFQLMEEEPLNYLVGSLSTESGLRGNMTPQEFGDLRYSFLDQTDMQKLFTINDQSGDLQTKVQIDREVVCNFGDICNLRFDIAIHSITVPTVFSIYTVQITLLDKNDNSPVFPSNIVNLEIIESATIGATLTLDDARDGDSSPQFSVQSYEIIPSNGAFRLETTPKADGGFWLNLKLQQTLDRETLDQYQLQVNAMDGGNPPKVGILTVNIQVTDDNDNAPIFIQDVYNISIAEGTGLNTAILALSASDKDIGNNGQVVYRFGSRQPGLDSINSLFAINQTTGFISVIGNIVFEAGKVFKIYVEASDKGTSPKVSQATVFIHVLDTGNNQPIIRINFLLPGSNKVVNISESTNIATVIASLSVEDPDTGPNGNVSCDLSGDFLTLQPITNKKGYLVMIQKKFDRESQDYHDILVTCRDQGAPVKSTTETFHVRVLDDNDCEPKFSQVTYFAEVEENNPEGVLITKVSAKDDDLSPNNVIQYFLDTDAEDRFSISSASGVVTANIAFDRETALNYKFTVLAVDSGNPPLTGTTSILLTIKDKNDNAPFFDVPFFQFFVEENKPSDVTIGTLTAHDRDSGNNKEITFSIDQKTSDMNFPFVVLPKGQVNTNAPLDREKHSSYEFTVIARDQGFPQLSASIAVKVYVSDDNDNRPNITFPNALNNTVRVPYSVDTGTLITQVRAVDLDETGPNSQLTYDIKAGNQEDVFMIGTTTGKVFLKRTYEVKTDKVFPLLIEVSDNGRTKLNSTQTLRIVLVYTNATAALESSGSGNRNIIISIVVIALTIIISAAMIAIILVLRHKDKQEKKQSQQPLTFPQITPQEKVMMNGGGVPMDMQIKKKKEVSFSIDEDLENMELANSSSTSNSLYHDYERSQDKYKMHKKGLHVDLPDHKDQHSFDNLSELSDEATNSDSGHGSSDVDLTNQSSGGHSDLKLNFAPKSVRLQPILSAKCQSPQQADDVLTIVKNSGHRNSYDNSHQSLILDNRKKSNRGQKSKDNWVPSYV